MTNLWEEIKQEIRRLCEEGKTLEEVMSHMKQKYDFHASCVTTSPLTHRNLIT